MRLTSQRKWYDLNYIPVPDEIKDLIKQCKNLDFEIDLILLYLNRRVEFPRNYILNLRTLMWGIVTSYLCFLHKHVEDEKARITLTEDLIEIRKMISSKEDETIESESENRWERLEQYITAYKEFLYSYVFNSLKMVEDEYIQDMPTKLANRMIQKIGILKIPKEEKEGTGKIIFKTRKEPEEE